MIGSCDSMLQYKNNDLYKKKLLKIIAETHALGIDWATFLNQDTTRE